MFAHGCDGNGITRARSTRGAHPAIDHRQKGRQQFLLRLFTAYLAAGRCVGQRLRRSQHRPQPSLVHRTRATPPADVLAEQARIDRVFINGWAIDYGPDTPVVKKLRHLQVHLLAVGAADEGAFDRHGYANAMRTQIDYGIFDYCGAKVVTSALLLESESGGAQAHLQKARGVGQGLFQGETVAG